MQEKEETRVKSPCLGNITLVHLAQLIALALTIIMGAATYIVQLKDLPIKILENKESIVNNKNDIIGLKTDSSEMKSDIKNIKQNTDIILKHILRKK